MQVVVVAAEEDVSSSDGLSAVCLLRPPVDRFTGTVLVAVDDAEAGAVHVEDNGFVVLGGDRPCNVHAGCLGDFRDLTVHEQAQVVGGTPEGVFAATPCRVV